MREYRMHQFGFGGFKLHSHHIALNHLGDLIPYHMSAEQLAAVSIKHNLYETIGLAQGNSLAIGRKWTLAHTDRAPRETCLPFGQAHMSNLRVTKGECRNPKIGRE